MPSSDDVRTSSPRPLQETFSWGPGRYQLDASTPRHADGSCSNAVSEAVTSALAELKSAWADSSYEIDEVSISTSTVDPDFILVSVMFICTIKGT